MKWIEWIEPFGPNDEPVYCRVPETTAIAVQRSKHNYNNDQQALDDFIAVHWAYVKEEPDEKRTPILNPFDMLMRAVNGTLTSEDYGYVQSVTPKPLLSGAAEPSNRPTGLVSG